MIELHCHLDGSVSPELLSCLAAEQGLDLPHDAEGMRALLAVPLDCSNLGSYLKKFDYTLACLQTADALERAAYDCLAQGHAEGLLYQELRFAPALHTRKGLTTKAAARAAYAGIRQAEKTFGIKSGVIVCLLCAATEDDNEASLQAALTLAGCGVVGLDLAGNEAAASPKQYRRAFEAAVAAGLGLTIHAGEQGDAGHVLEAAEMGASRIGHGLALAERPEIARLCQPYHLTLEICPTSNYQTKAVRADQPYPFDALCAAGFMLTLNTDNRTMSQTTLAAEFALLERQGISLRSERQARLAHNAIEVAFTDSVTKAWLRAKVEARFAASVSANAGSQK